MPKPKTLVAGQWIKTSMLSKRFKVGLCSRCTKGRCGPVWYNFFTKKTVCLTCLPDPYKEPYKE